jgi:hypothetical protein
MQMKKQLGSFVFAATLGLVAPLAVGADKPMAVEADVTVVTATVEAVDYDKRTVAIKGPAGNVLVLKVGKAAQNLNQVKKGDQVKMEYADALAVSLQKAAPGAKPGAASVSGVEVAGKGSKPFVEVTNTVFAVAKIESVDAKTRVVTIIGPEKTVKLKVAKGVIGLEGLKKGDDVSVEYTDAIAFAVTKP